MARPLRIQYPNAWYHVFNRGRRKEKIFFHPADYQLFLSIVEKVTQRFRIEVHAYSLMPNHYHLMIKTPKANLSESIRYLDAVYTQKINKKYKYEGALLRGRFKSILIEEKSYLLELVRYIHLNPFKAGLETRIGTHPWTSHACYLNPKQKPLWLETEAVLTHFSSDPVQARHELHHFILERIPVSIEKRLSGENWPSILGTNKFKTWIKEQLLRRPIKNSEEVPQMKDVKKNLSLQDLLIATSNATNLTREQILQSRRAVDNPARRAFIYLANVEYGFKSREISEYLGTVKPPAILKQLRIAEQEKVARMGCYAKLGKIREKLQVKT